MLADEPTGSLDSRNGHEIVKLLKKSNKEYGQTLILVTHDKNIALQADRIIRISDGMILQDERQTTSAAKIPDRKGTRPDSDNAGSERQVERS